MGRRSLTWERLRSRSNLLDADGLPWNSFTSENFWSLLMRCAHGTYIALEQFHPFRYLDEQSFRYNNRKASNAQRFNRVLQTAHGKHLTYDTLIGENVADGRSSADRDGGSGRAESLEGTTCSETEKT